MDYKLANLIEIYQNEHEGYIKYSNGYCRQWGIVIELCQSKTITLPISFKDTNYNVQVSHYGASTSHTDMIATAIAPLTNNKIIVNKPSESYKWVSWAVEGFWK